jgi:hypothetical protein
MPTHQHTHMSWDRAVGVVTSYRVQGFNPGSGKKFPLLHNCPDWVGGPQNFLFIGYWGTFPQVTLIVYNISGECHLLSYKYVLVVV